MRWVLALLLLGLSGCFAHHVLVVRDQAPVYDAPEGDRVVAHLSRYHHQPLRGDPDARPRLEVALERGHGWIARRDVRVFSYLDPIWDAGADRDATVAAELRGLQLEELGQDWSPDVVEQVRRGEVEEGFTREQVQVAWGWPPTVEAGPVPGGQRWIYRDRGLRRVQRWIDPFPYYGFYPPFSYVPGYGYAPQPWSPGFYHPRSITIRVPVTIERVVDFDAAGRVVELHSRRLLDDDDED